MATSTTFTYSTPALGVPVYQGVGITYSSPTFGIPVPCQGVTVAYSLTGTWEKDSAYFTLRYRQQTSLTNSARIYQAYYAGCSQKTTHIFNQIYELLDSVSFKLRLAITYREASSALDRQLVAQRWFSERTTQVGSFSQAHQLADSTSDKRGLAQGWRLTKSQREYHFLSTQWRQAFTEPDSGLIHQEWRQLTSIFNGLRLTQVWTVANSQTESGEFSQTYLTADSQAENSALAQRWALASWTVKEFSAPLRSQVTREFATEFQTIMAAVSGLTAVIHTRYESTSEFRAPLYTRRAVPTEFSARWSAFALTPTLTDFKVPLLAQIQQTFLSPLVTEIPVSLEFITEFSGFPDTATSLEFKLPLQSHTSGQFFTGLATEIAVLSEFTTSFSGLAFTRTVAEFNADFLSQISRAFSGPVATEVPVTSEFSSVFSGLAFTRTVADFKADFLSQISHAFSGPVATEVPVTSEFSSLFSGLAFTRTVAEFNADFLSQISRAFSGPVATEVPVASEFNSVFSGLAFTRTVADFKADFLSQISHAFSGPVATEVPVTSEFATSFSGLAFSATSSEFRAAFNSQVSRPFFTPLATETAVLSEFATSFSGLAFSATSSEFRAAFNSQVSQQFFTPLATEIAVSAEFKAPFTGLENISTLSAFHGVFNSQVSQQFFTPVATEIAVLSDFKAKFTGLENISTLSAFHGVFNSQVSQQFFTPLATEIAVSAEFKAPFTGLENISTLSAFHGVFNSQVNQQFFTPLTTEIPVLSEFKTQFTGLEQAATFKEWRTLLASQITPQFIGSLVTVKAVLIELKTSFGLSTPVTTVFTTIVESPPQQGALKEFLAPFIASELPIQIISNENYLVHKQRRVELLDDTIAQDWETYLWSGKAELASQADYVLMRSGDAVTLIFQGIAYSLVIEQRSHSDANGDPSFSLQLVSPTILLEYSRVTKTWDGVEARTACEELAGGVIDWQVLDWWIPAGRLTAQDETKISVIRRIAAAVGGIVQTKEEGQLRVQYKIPSAFNELATVNPDYIFSDRLHIFSYRESPPRSTPYNTVVITDEESRDSVDQGYDLSYETESADEGVLRVIPQPWTDQFSVESTAGHVVLGAGTVVYWEECERVEFKKGEASVAFPIMVLLGFRWQDKDLGEVVWAFDSKDLQVGAVYGVAWVHYKTRAFEFPVTSAVTQPELAQFVVKEEDVVRRMSGIRIQVKRGGGDSQKPDIVSPLSATLPVALQLGRVEMDLGENRMPVNQSVIFTPCLVGAVVESFDRLEGAAWRGVVTSVQHGLSSDGSCVTELGLLR